MKHSESKHIYEIFEMPVAEVSPRHEVIPNGQPRVEACSQRGDHIVTWKILSGTALVFFLNSHHLSSTFQVPSLPFSVFKSLSSDSLEFLKIPSFFL